MVKRRINKNKERTIAKGRIERLFDFVELYAKKDLELAKKYVDLIVRLAQKHNIRLTKDQKIKFCKKCHTPWIFGENVEVQVNKKTGCVEYTCKECGHVKRVRYK